MNSDFYNADFPKYKDLPMPVYVSDVQGRVLSCNAIAKSLFKIDDFRNFRLAEIYFDPEDRMRFLQEAGKKREEWSTTEGLKLVVGDEIQRFNFMSKSFWQNNKLIGFICMLSKVDSFSGFRSFQNDVNFGLFEIGKNNQLIYYNNAFAHILGIENFKYGSEYDIVDFLCPANNASSSQKKEYYKSIIKGLQKSGELTKQIVKVANIRGEEYDLVVNMKIGQIRNGRIVSVKGIVESNSFKNIYKIIDELNIALFTLKRQGDRFVISDANKYFKSIFENSSIEKFDNIEFRTLFDEKYSEKIQQALLTERKEQFNINVRNVLWDPSNIEYNIHIQKVPDALIESYVSIMYSTTDEVNKTIRGMRDDFSSFLHSYSAMAGNIKDTLQGVIGAHGTSAVSRGKLNVSLALNQIKIYMRSFMSALKVLRAEVQEKNLNTSIFGQIAYNLDQIYSDDNSNVSVKIFAGLYRNQFVFIRENIKRYRDYQKLSNSCKRKLNVPISEILRYCRIISIHHLEQEAFEMGLDVQSFKDIMISQSVVNVNNQFKILKPIDKAIGFLSEYGLRRILRINKTDRTTTEGLIIGDERNLFTVFYNLIHNAVKYSFIKPDREVSTVEVVIVEKDVSYIVEVINRGVRISAKEIESGELFDFAARGKSSVDRERKGHGIGLFHCKNIINQFRGSIEIFCRPVDHVNPRIDQIPHITTFKVTLPKNKSYGL